MDKFAKKISVTVKVYMIAMAFNGETTSTNETTSFGPKSIGQMSFSWHITVT